MTDLKVVALGFALCAWCEFAQAEVQSRTDTIESARTEKEANLKPETPPKGGARYRMGRTQPSIPAGHEPGGWLRCGVGIHRPGPEFWGGSHLPQNRFVGRKARLCSAGARIGQ